MPEQLTNQPERSELEAKRYEVERIVRLNEYIQELIPMAHQNDWGLDDLYDLGRSIARRDPQMGHMLVEALESQEENKVLETEALIFSDRIRGVLGLPQRWPDRPPEGFVEQEASQPHSDGA